MNPEDINISCYGDITPSKDAFTSCTEPNRQSAHRYKYVPEYLAPLKVKAITAANSYSDA